MRHQGTKGPVLTILVVVSVITNLAHARIVHVDIDAAGANNGASWADAFRSLQDALAAG